MALISLEIRKEGQDAFLLITLPDTKGTIPVILKKEFSDRIEYGKWRADVEWEDFHEDR